MKKATIFLFFTAVIACKSVANRGAQPVQPTPHIPAYKGLEARADGEDLHVEIALYDSTFNKTIRETADAELKHATGRLERKGDTLWLKVHEGGDYTYLQSDSALIPVLNGETLDPNQTHHLKRVVLDENLMDYQWVLIELNGRRIPQNDKTPTVSFMTYNHGGGGFGGCNSFGFTYEWAPQGRIRMSEFISTLLFCEKSIEDEYLSTLREADSYTISDHILQLNRARRAPLARFQRIQSETP